MGKSKYQMKAQKSLETSNTATKATRPKYYDEEFLEKKKQKAQTTSGAPGVAIFLTVMIAASVFGVIVYVDSTKPLEEQIILPFLRGDNSGDVIETIVIERGDTVSMHYRLWADLDRDGFIDTSQEPYQETSEGQPFSTEVQPDKLILGFYNNLLGMEEGEEKTFELPANEDINGDGYDDLTGDPVLSYTSGDLANMKLVFYIYIIAIQKG